MDIAFENYADEQVKTNRVYPAAYKGPRSLRKQVEVLAAAVPGMSLDATFSFIKKEVPQFTCEGSEGWFATIRSNLGGSPTLGLEMVLKALVAQSQLKLSDKQIEMILSSVQSEQNTRQMLRELIRQQAGDVVVFPAQFGILHAGCSDRRARLRCGSEEFTLGILQTGCMLLTHPERLRSEEDLQLACAGDEIDFDSDGSWDSSPCWRYKGNELVLKTRSFEVASPDFGCPTGFLPIKDRR